MIIFPLRYKPQHIVMCARNLAIQCLHFISDYIVVRADHVQQYAIMYSSTQLCTALRNYVQHYAIMYSSTQLCTAVRNYVQHYAIMYSSTQLCTAVRNYVQQYAIMYSSTQLCTAVRSSLSAQFSCSAHRLA